MEHHLVQGRAPTWEHQPFPLVKYHAIITLQILYFKTDNKTCISTLDLEVFRNTTSTLKKGEKFCFKKEIIYDNK
jgi:hypothetical protein